MLEKLLEFETLTSSGKDGKRIFDERGEFVQIINGDSFRHLVYIDIKQDHFRGSHYHLKREETFYVLSGTVRAVFESIETKERFYKILAAGDKVRISPKCAHVISAIQYSQLVHFSKEEYDPGDTYPYDFGGLQ